MGGYLNNEVQVPSMPANAFGVYSVETVINSLDYLLSPLCNIWGFVQLVHPKYQPFPLLSYHLWFCLWGGCTIIFCQLLHIDPGKAVILVPLLLCRFYGMCKWLGLLWPEGIFVVIVIINLISFTTLLSSESDYHHLIYHYYADSFICIENINAYQTCFLQCVSTIKSNLFNNFYAMVGAVDFQLSHYLLMMVRIFALQHIIITKSPV